jgi:hypothetical protein
LNPNSSTKEWFRYDADCLVSLKEESLQTTNFKIYPNPTHSHLTIKSSEQIFSLGIFNSTGQLVLEPHPSHLATDIDLNVSSLPKGIYFIRVNQAQALMVILMD